MVVTFDNATENSTLVASLMDLDGRKSRQFLVDFNFNDNDKDGEPDIDDLDDDNDQILDEWELTHFLNPYKNDASEDIDGDGMSNIDEYLDSLNPTGLCGDFDNDGNVQLADLILILQHISGINVPISEASKLSDCSGDQAVGLEEAVSIINEISGDN